MYDVARICFNHKYVMLVTVFSELHYMLSPTRLSSVCLSVMLVHPTQAFEIFRNISAALGTLAVR